MVRLKASITDTRFDSAALYTITLYNADPALGGKVITKGFASVKTAFSSTVTIPKTLSSVYIVKTAPNNTVIMVRQSVEGGSIIASIGGLIQVPTQNPVAYPEPIDQ